MSEVAEAMQFDAKALSNSITRDENLIKLAKSPAIMAGSLKEKFSSEQKTQNLKESKTSWLSSDPNESCSRLKLLLQEKQAGKKSNIFDEEIVAIGDKLLEYKCISTKQHSRILSS